MRTPAASAMRTRLRRSPLTASRASRMLSQTGVPTSTTLLWSSGLIWSPRWAPAASISSMWLLSSRVAGSTSWNSSSMPIVNFSGMGADVGIVAGKAGAAGLRSYRLAPVLLALLARAAAAQEPAAALPRGPIELRDEWLPAQNRLTLPAVSTDVLAPGALRLRVSLDAGNDFGWRQNIRGESPLQRDFLVDGEHRTLALELRRGLGDRVETGARLPLRWRGGGFLDGVIDAVHGVTVRLGLPDNQRPFFLSDRFRVLGRDAQGRAVSW